MPCYLYSIRDAPKQETFREQLAQIGLDIVHWEVPSPGRSAAVSAPPDVLVYSTRDMLMFVLCAPPRSGASQIDIRVREARVTIRAGLIPRGNRTYEIGQDRLEMRGLGVAMLYQEKGQVIRGGGAPPERSISLVMKPAAIEAKLRDRVSRLPVHIKDVLLGKRSFHREGRVSGRLMSLISSLEDLLRLPPEFLDLHAEATATSFLAASLDTLSALAPATAGPTPAEAVRLESVRTLIEENPARHHDVEDLGRLAAMNRTKLRAAFKLVYGMTLSDYQAGARMRLAKRRLRSTDLSIESVAHDVGYANAASFVVAYKAFFGSTPGRSRKR